VCRQNLVDIHGRKLIEQLDPIFHRRCESHVRHAARAEHAGREHHAGVGEKDEGIAGLLAGPEISEAGLAPAQPDRHLAVESDVGQHEPDLGWIVAAAFEEIAAPRHLLRLHLRHDTGGFALGHERGAGRFERRVAEMVVAMEMAVDHPSNRFVRQLANPLQQVLAVAGMLARVDHEHTVRRGKDDRIGGGELEQKIEVGRHLLERDVAGRGRLLGHRGGWEQSGGQRHDARKLGDVGHFHRLYLSATSVAEIGGQRPVVGNGQPTPARKHRRVNHRACGRIARWLARAN
jgi:hypothetical protein